MVKSVRSYNLDLENIEYIKVLHHNLMLKSKSLFINELIYFIRNNKDVEKQFIEYLRRL